jgi:hypothetical protein
VIRQIAWCEDAANSLARALPGAVRDIVAGEVIAGVSLLWECKDDKHSAYVVTRLDWNPVELVVVAYEGSGMMHFGPHFVGWAKAKGIPCRAHVTSPVVERLLRKLGLKRSEVIVRAAA